MFHDQFMIVLMSFARLLENVDIIDTFILFSNTKSLKLRFWTG